MMNTTKNIFKYSEPIVSTVQSTSIARETFRLDGQFHIMFDNSSSTGYKVADQKSLIKCCHEIFEVPIFKHIYVEEGKGVPFYTSSGLFEADLKPTHHLSPLLPNLHLYRIKKGQILMARSGNVEAGILGQLIMVGDFLHDKTTSDHVIRFTPNDEEINPGYLFTFLRSDYCRGQLIKNASGGVIPAIRPESLFEIMVPCPDKRTQEQIGNKIIQSVLLREQANELLEDADCLIHEYNHLPLLKITDAEYFDKEKEIQSRILSSTHISNEYRLDAYYYNPIAELARTNIQNKTDYKELLYFTNDIIIGKRFKRNYVQAEYGIPFLSGKNIIQIKPTDLNYLSSSETGFMNDLLVEKNWILVTCSGTLGRTCLVYNNYEGYAASQHILRVVPNRDLVDPGYLYAFIASKYGYYQLVRHKYGAVIDEIDDNQIANILIPIPKDTQQQTIIGDKVRLAYDKRAQAISLEDEAQEILKQSLEG